MINIYIANIKNLYGSPQVVDNIVLNLSTYRKEKYLALKSEEMKLQSIAAAYLIDEHLKTLNLREKDMDYVISKAGKPYFKNHRDIYFSISHSKNIVGVAFSDKEVGLDIQVVRDINENIFDRVLSKSEISEVFKGNEENDLSKPNLEKFFEYWVIKEAILKREATGLRDDIADIKNDYGVVRKFKEDNDTYFICVNNKIDSNYVIKLVIL